MKVCIIELYLVLLRVLCYKVVFVIIYMKENLLYVLILFDIFLKVVIIFVKNFIYVYVIIIYNNCESIIIVLIWVDICNFF